MQLVSSLNNSSPALPVVFSAGKYINQWIYRIHRADLYRNPWVEIAVLAVYMKENCSFAYFAYSRISFCPKQQSDRTESGGHSGLSDQRET